MMLSSQFFGIEFEEIEVHDTADAKQQTRVECWVIIQFIDTGTIIAQLPGEPDGGFPLPFQFSLDTCTDVQFFSYIIHLFSYFSAISKTTRRPSRYLGSI